MTYPTEPSASYFINGQYVEDATGTPIDVIYPATGAVIGRICSATAAIIDQALDAARVAQGSWAVLTGTERGRIFWHAPTHPPRMPKNAGTWRCAARFERTDCLLRGA